MSGWFPCSIEAWEAMAEQMPKPWPRALILMDLRYWADRQRMGKAKRPGRPALARRWGVTSWMARQCLKAEDEWGDPAASSPPVRRQSAASLPPAATTAKADNAPETASRPPVDRQSAASPPPHARKDTDTHTDTHLSAPPTEDPSPTGPADRLWARWREASPATGKRWPKGSPVKAAVKELGEETCALMIDWLWQAPDSGKAPSAAWLREHRTTTGLATTIWRAGNRSDYAEQAKAWDAAGRPTTARKVQAAQKPVSNPLDDVLAAIRAVPSTCQDKRGAVMEAVGEDRLRQVMAAGQKAGVNVSDMARLSPSSWDYRRQHEAVMRHLEEQP